MTTPPAPGNGARGVGCRLGQRTLSKSLTKQQRLPSDNCLVVLVEGCTVRIIGGDRPTGVPRRQGFAWKTDARAYAERLSAERGWQLKHG